MSSLTVEELVRWQSTREFTLLDVRLAEVRHAEPATIAGARWVDPAAWQTWLPELAKDELVAVFCAHGRSVSQSTATRLREAGIDVYFLEGGLAAWKDSGRLVMADYQ